MYLVSPIYVLVLMFLVYRYDIVNIPDILGIPERLWIPDILGISNIFGIPEIMVVPGSIDTEMSETLVSRLRLRPGWSQSRSQALRPKHQSLSLNFWDQKSKVSVSKFETRIQKSRSQSQSLYSLKCFSMHEYLQRCLIL